MYFSARTLQLNRRGQLTERFTKAIEQLGESGPDKLPIRLGGIYALEQIAMDSSQLHWPVMEVLTAFLRRSSANPPPDTSGDTPPAEGASEQPLPTLLPSPTEPPEDALERVLAFRQASAKLAADLQAAATVIGRRSKRRRRSETVRLDLFGVQLPGVNLIGAHLDDAIFTGATLEGGLLINAHLEGARFDRAELAKLFAAGARMQNASLIEANLSGASLYQAHFNHADLTRARLAKAILARAQMNGAKLDDAHLEDGYLPRARMKEVTLNGAFLTGAELFGTGLTRDQLKGAHIDETTRLPEKLIQTAQEHSGDRTS